MNGRKRTMALMIFGLVLAASEMAARAEGAEALKLEASQAWAPSTTATPVTSRAAETVLIQGNESGTCCGGWQFVYSGVRGGETYRIRTSALCKEVEQPRDALVAMVAWDRWEATSGDMGQTPWHYLMPKPAAGGRIEFENTVTAPEGATALTVRYTLRWTRKGATEWSAPQIETAKAPERKAVKICIITPPSRQKDRKVKIEALSEGLGLPKEVAESVDLYGSLALEACKRKPDLILTPEIAIGGKNAMTGSVEVPGPATRVFEKIAREHGVHLILGMRQREGDAFYNICALIGPEGKVDGIYRKVHLATSEGLAGLTPGDSFPVFKTKIGRIGCLICMDTMLPESARMLAMGGADFVCLPIMGDLRADRWSPGPPIFSEDRWKALMRTRAIDNQLTMVIARNQAQGSCVIDRKGDFLAWNEGEQEIIEATVPARDGYTSWDGGDVRETTWMLRRPHLYGAYTEEFGLKALEEKEAAEK